MSNTSGVILGGLVIFFAGVAGLAINWLERNERPLRQFFASLDPNLTTAEFHGLCVVCGFWLFVAGLIIDTYGEEFRGDS